MFNNWSIPPTLFLYWCQKMNINYLTFFYVLITFLLSLASSTISYHPKQIPAIYVFGDSLVDSGNNNYLPIQSNAKFPPYGIDFCGGKPTGRYTNGKTVVDYLGEKTQFTFFTMSFLCFLKS